MVLTRVVHICNQLKHLPTISTVYLYYVIIVQVFCAVMSNKLIQVRVWVCSAVHVLYVCLWNLRHQQSSILPISNLMLMLLCYFHFEIYIWWVKYTYGDDNWYIYLYSLGYLLIYPLQIATVMKLISFCSKYNPVSQSKSLGESWEWNMVLQGNTWYHLKALKNL